MTDVDADFTLFSKLALNPFHQIISFMEYFWMAYMHNTQNVGSWQIIGEMMD